MYNFFYFSKIVIKFQNYVKKLFSNEFYKFKLFKKYFFLFFSHHSSLINKHRLMKLEARNIAMNKMFGATQYQIY